ncbi:MAG: phospho-N-acetylmuramoyl-pentapeptide-transferase [Erysipelotrichaceae bacterium]|nr:phospho-N-acetylmuramoyl-pentapeptide-transferase [Erysipelotrichaceae bacterium]
MLRLFLASMISLILMFIIMPNLISFMKNLKYNQVASEYSLEEFKEKAGTPTMGGVAFVIVPVIALFIIYPRFYTNAKILLVVLTYLGYGLIGFIDDYLIVVKNDNEGLKPAYKFGLQLLLSVVFYLIYRRYATSTVTIPFLNKTVDLGWGYALLVFFMFTGSSNAVNLTDGMDGLASGCSIFAILPFIYVAIKQDQFYIAVLLAGVGGALLGYLRYNIKPAMIFMGDTGSLALGGLLAAVAIVLKKEFDLAIIGGVFVMETLCVIIQQVAVRVFHKRVFRYTPIHYAFKLNGMAEMQVVYVFWLASIICSGLGIILEAMF